MWVACFYVLDKNSKRQYNNYKTVNDSKRILKQ